ncbi:hypothetical protein AX14_009404 [Amanita brunnescens Koide BX004]|nr:hypothetical protein AX14_009404 [Amanita brunnescens Koide BX004]
MARSALPISCTHCIRRLLAPAILSASLSVSHGLSICQLRSLFHTRIPNTCIYLLSSQNDKILPKVTQKCSAAYNDTIDNLISLIRFHQFSESSLPWYSLITTITCTLYPNFTALSSMWSKLAFAAFVLTLLTHSKKFTVVQAQTLLQPRDALPNQSNLAQDEILPHDYLTSLSFANTSDTYLDSEANLEHTIVARKNPPQPLTRHPPPVLPTLKVPLNKETSQYTARIFLGHRDSQLKPFFDVVFATTAFDHMWLVDAAMQERNQRIFAHKYSPTAINHEKEIAVKIFGGEGHGRIFRTTIAIEDVDLGEILVGFLRTITGFGGEIGDGVIPFARLSMDRSRTRSAWARIIGTRAINDRIGAFALREDAGEVHIGMIEHEAYVGPIEFHTSVGVSPFWAIDGATIYVGLQNLNAGRIIFDTTSQFIRGPGEKVEQIYDGIIGLKIIRFHEDLGLYEILCDFELQRIGIGLHRDWWIEPRHFVQSIVTRPHLCFGLIAAHTMNTMSDDGYKAKPNPMPKPSDWIIGYPVMMGHYTILDWGKRRIGIAELNASYSFD